MLARQSALVGLVAHRVKTSVASTYSSRRGKNKASGLPGDFLAGLSGIHVRRVKEGDAQLTARWTMGRLSASSSIQRDCDDPKPGSCPQAEQTLEAWNAQIDVFHKP